MDNTFPIIEKNGMAANDVLRLADIHEPAISILLSHFTLELKTIAQDCGIPGSF